METNEAKETMGKEALDLIEDHIVRQRERALRLERQTEDQVKSASDKFQKLVDVALFDGYLSNSEAHMLVQEHNRMQEKSRAHLRKILTDNGHINIAAEGVRRGHMYSNPQVSNSDAHGREGYNPLNYSQWTDEAQKEIESIFLDDSDAIRFVERVGDVVKRPGKKATFFLIIAVPIIVVLLRLTGVI